MVLTKLYITNICMPLAILSDCTHKDVLHVAFRYILSYYPKMHKFCLSLTCINTYY